MQVIDVKDLRRWESVASGEVLLFVTTGQLRNVRLEVNSSGPVAIFAADGDQDRRLVAWAAGLFEVAFSVEGEASVTFEFPPNVEVFFSSLARPQTAEPVGFEVHSTVVPMQGQTSEYERLLRTVRANELRREAMVADQLARLQAAADEAGRSVRQQEAIEHGRADAAAVDAANAAAAASAGGGARPPAGEPPDGRGE